MNKSFAASMINVTAHIYTDEISDVGDDLDLEF